MYLFLFLWLSLIAVGRVSAETEYLAENWIFHPFLERPGYTEIGVGPEDNQYPSIVLDFSDGRWGIASNDFGQNGYSIKWKSPVQDYAYGYKRMLYKDMLRLGRDQVVMVYRYCYKIYDRVSREMVSEIAIEHSIAEACIADFDNDGDPDIFIDVEGETKMKVYDLDSGLFLREYNQMASIFAVAQADDDPQKELIFSSGFNGPGYVIDLLTDEIQLVYEDGFGNHLSLGDIDLDGKDELVANLNEGSIGAIDLDIPIVKWEKQIGLLYDSVYDTLITDIDKDNWPEVVISSNASGQYLLCCRGDTGETIWSSNSFCQYAVSLNAADLDLDGCMEIVGIPKAEHSHDYEFLVFDTCSLEIDWESSYLMTSFSVFNVGNIDCLGINEIMIGPSGYPQNGPGSKICIFDPITHRLRNEIWTGDSEGGGEMFLLEVVEHSPGMEMAIVRNRNMVLRNALTQDLLWETEYQIGCALPADIDGDGDIEIVATGSPYYYYDDHLVVYNGSSGSKEFEGSAMGARGTWMEIEDIDDDGTLEIGIRISNRLVIFNGASETIEWSISSSEIGSMDFGDLMTGIPGIEILYGIGQTLHVINGVDHSPVVSFELPFGSNDNLCSLEVADVDSDGVPEMIMQSRYMLYCVDSTGNTIWSSQIDRQDGPYSDGQRNIICDDLNNDNVSEVLISHYGGFIEYRYGSPGIPPVPACETTGVSLEISGTMFFWKDTFFLDATVCNATDSVLTNHHVFIILDVFGEYYFLPSWTNSHDGIDSYHHSIPPGAWQFQVVPMFNWPVVYGSANGLIFWGAITDPDITGIIGELNSVSFGWI